MFPKLQQLLFLGPRAFWLTDAEKVYSKTSKMKDE
jgi:hypothetical protein